MSRIFMVILLLISFKAVAQKTHIISLKPTKSIDDTDFSFTKIIDNRTNKDSIGNVIKGLILKRVPANLGRSFELELLFAVSKIIPRKKEHAELGIVFHHFNIKEKIIQGQEIGQCTVELEFVQEIDSVLYSLGYFEAAVANTGIDVTNGHSRRITKALIKCINDFKQTDWRKNKKLFVLNESNVLPITLGQVPKKGFYQSFDKMVQNKPYSETDFSFDAQSSKKLTRYFPKTKSESIRRRTNYISDGGNLYIKSSQYSYGKHFVKISATGKYYYFKDRGGMTEDEITSVYLSKYGYTPSSQYITSGGVYGYVLDFETGVITRLGDRSFFKLISRYPEIVKIYRDSKRKLEDRRAAIIALNKTFELK